MFACTTVISSNLYTLLLGDHIVSGEMLVSLHMLTVNALNVWYNGTLRTHNARLNTCYIAPTLTNGDLSMQSPGFPYSHKHHETATFRSYAQNK